MPKEFAIMCLFIIICRIGYKKRTLGKIIPLNRIDYIVIAIVTLVMLYFYSASSLC
jgi:hypothetical protein